MDYITTLLDDGTPVTYPACVSNVILTGDYNYNAILPTEIVEENGQRTEQYSLTEFSAHATYFCPWNGRFRYIDRILGTVYNAPQPYFTYFYPAQATSVQVSNVGAEGLSSGSSMPSFQPYSMAKLSVEYKGFARCGNWSIDEQVQPSIQMRQLPSWGFYWQSDGSPVLDAESPGIQEVTSKITRNLKGLRRIPEWFFRLSGCVNANLWADNLTGQVYLPGTLMFIASNMHKEMTYKNDDDDNIWDVSFELNWRPIGWNHFRRPHCVDAMAYNQKYVRLYPFQWFPAMTAHPDDISTFQYWGNPYNVLLQDASTGVISNLQINEVGDPVVSAMCPT